jgi:uncharacterized protein
LSAARSATPLLGVGEVRHTRFRPARNAFRYASFFLLLPMRSLRDCAAPALARNRFGLISFYDRDHGDGRADSLAWLDELLVREGVQARGEVWLQCYPRVLGYVFKPVSFWYCHRVDGSLAAVVAEVNNTFGERHCYLLEGAAYGRELRSHKVFHVSPFCTVQGDYRFRFMRTEERCVARIEHHDEKGALLNTSLSGQLAPLTPARQRAAFFGMPLMTLGVIARIHWQAMKLLCKRVPFHRKPAAPTPFVTR